MCAWDRTAAAELPDAAAGVRGADSEREVAAAERAMAALLAEEEAEAAARQAAARKVGAPTPQPDFALLPGSPPFL